MAPRSLGVFVILLALCVFPLHASAQATAPPGQTITVTGEGRASGPVTGANVIAIVYGKSVDPPGLQAVLGRAGVTNFIPDQSRLSGLPSVAGIRGRMPSATRTDIDAVTAAVRAYVKAHSGTQLIRLAFFGLSVNCPVIAARSRADALADAHARAEALAADAHVHVGTLVSVTESQACPPPGPLAGAYAIDAQTLMMTVPVRETVTYATAP